MKKKIPLKSEEKPAKKAAIINKDDVDLFHHTMAAHDTKVHAKTKAHAKKHLPELKADKIKTDKIIVNISAQKAIKPTSILSTAQTAPLKKPPNIAKIDEAEWRKIKNRKRRIDARIDLHHMREEAAHQKVLSFIATAKHRGYYTLLIITGKGDAASSTLRHRHRLDDAVDPNPFSGILRKNLSRWLAASEVRPFISGLSPAAPIDGGDGAFYLTLKK